MALKRRDPAEPPNRAVLVTMAVMLIVATAFWADLYRGVTPLRLVVFISLAGTALFFFRRGLGKRQ